MLYRCGDMFPIPSMYGIFTYIGHEHQENVGKYTIHGWHGDVWSCHDTLCMSHDEWWLLIKTSTRFHVCRHGVLHLAFPNSNPNSIKKRRTLSGGTFISAWMTWWRLLDGWKLALHHRFGDYAPLWILIAFEVWIKNLLNMTTINLNHHPKPSHNRKLSHQPKSIGWALTFHTPSTCERSKPVVRSTCQSSFTLLLLGCQTTDETQVKRGCVSIVRVFFWIWFGSTPPTHYPPES